MSKSFAFALAGALLLGAVGAAQAATLSASINGSPVAGATLYSFNGLTGDTADLGGGTTLTLNNGAQFVSGSLANEYAAPWVGGAGGAQDTNTYISVYGGTSATFNFATPQNTFGLLWGSVDTDSNRNLVTLYNGNTVVGSFQGSDIANQVGGLQVGSWGYGGTVYANISSATPFTSAVVSDSSSNSFEFDNVSVSAVPLPGAMPLFGSAIIGLGLLARRRRPATGLTA